MAEAPASTRTRPLGCVAAPAIGAIVIGLYAATFSLLTGRPLNLASEWVVLLFQMLIVAIPFLVLALIGARTWLPWLVGLGLTLAAWTYVLFESVSYQGHPDGSGANIGLGLLMIFVVPPAITTASVGAHAWRRRRARRE